jgi:hypothetical protein
MMINIRCDRSDQVPPALHSIPISPPLRMGLFYTAGASVAPVRRALKEHRLADTTLTGTYER